MDSFDTLKLLYALFVLGLLMREEKHEVIHEVAVGVMQPTDSPQLVLDFGSQSPVAAPEPDIPVVALKDFEESEPGTDLVGEILESNLTTGVTEEYVDTTEYDLTSDQESVSSLIDVGRGEDQVTAELPLPGVIPEAEPGSDSAEASGWPSTIGTLAAPADVVTLETPKKESATPVLDGPTFSREVPGTAERLDWLKENRESMFHRPQRTNNTVRNAIAIAAIVIAAGAGGWWYWSHEIAREISPAAPAARGGRMMVPIPPQVGQGSDESTTTSPLPEAVETSGVSDTGPGEVMPTGPEGASSAEGASEETVTSSPVLPVAAATGTVGAASLKVTSKPVAQAQKPEKPSPPPYIALSRDAIRDGYDRRAETYKEDANPNEFSIQFALVCQTSSLTKALEGGGGAVWFGRVQYRDQPCYRVFWKRFNDRGMAETAIAEIPGALRAGSKPVVVRIGDVLPR